MEFGTVTRFSLWGVCVHPHVYVWKNSTETEVAGFFLCISNHTMINCEDSHSLKKNTVFKPKISQAKKS